MSTVGGTGWRRRLVWPVLGVLVIAAGAWAWPWRDGGTGVPASAAGPVATATVERGTIAATQTWDGTLGYGRPYTVTSPAEGTVTRLTDVDDSVGRGTELYRLNERPVVLLYGEIPMYRDLTAGADGADAEQLAANLESLGYEGFTSESIRRWQGDVGAAETGIVSRADVMFLPEGGRVDSRHVNLGDLVRPGSPVLDLTGTEQVVAVAADLDDRDRFEVDTAVTVVLPGGDEVAGTVGTTAVVAAPPEGGGAPEPGMAELRSVLQVEIVLDEPVPDQLTGASTEVVLAIEERADVLLVPVTALLALAEGGYGLEVVRDDGDTEIVAVSVGLFADGKVQVEGGRIAEGTVVGVAGR